MTDTKGYFPMIKHFWQMCRRLSLTPSEIALFLALVDESNENFWASSFYVSNGWLTAKIGVSEPTLISARNKLGQYNLIRFKSGKSKRKPTKYSIPFLENYSTNLSDNLSSEQQNDTNHLNNLNHSLSSEQQKNPNYLNNFSESFSKSFSQCLRPNNNTNTNTTQNTNNKENFSKNNFEEENFSENENFEKPMEEKISKPPAETEISPSKKVAPKKVSQKTQESQVDALELPFESEEFRENWLGFRQVRKEMRKPVTPTAAKMIFKKLGKFSEEVATQALEASATNGWQGVFPENIVREQNYSAPKNTNQIIKPDFINADYSNTTL